METALEEVSVKKDAREILEPSTIKDPWELMASFYESERYKDAYEAFYEEKKIKEGVSEKEKEKTFLENKAAGFALIDFGTNEVLFRFDIKRFPPESLEAITDYVKTSEDLQKMDRGRLEKEDLETMDIFRRGFHQKAADALVKDGIAPTRAIGEAIASLVLIDKGIESPESVKRDSTVEKLRRKLGVKG